MKNKRGWLRFVKVFGFLYFLAHCAVFTVICIMALYTMIKTPQFSPGWVFPLFPAFGMAAGYWIRHGRYNWWRNLIIVLSLLVSAFVVFGMIFIFPQVKKINSFHETQAKRPRELEAGVQEFFNAIYGNDLDAVKKSLEAGVDVNAKNEAGETALHASQDEAILRILIDAGADVNAVDELLMTPIFNKDIGLERVLVEAGADIHARSGKGNTPLMFYAYSGYTDGIRYLLSLGVDVNAKNADGQTAYDIAEAFADFELLEYLKSVGARPGRDIK